MENEWEEGRTFFDFDDPEIEGGAGNYIAVVCMKARQVDEEGNPTAPAEILEVVASTWTAVRSAFRGLGLPCPPRSLVRMKDD